MKAAMHDLTPSKPSGRIPKPARRCVNDPWNLGPGLFIPLVFVLGLQQLQPMRRSQWPRPPWV